MSDLVEKVRAAVRPHLYSEGGNSEVVARAAIAAVAEWLEKSGSMQGAIVGNALLEQLEQPK